MRLEDRLGSSTLKPLVARIAKALSMFALGSEASAKLKYSFLALGVSESNEVFACSAVSFVGQIMSGRSDSIISPLAMLRVANAPNPLLETLCTQ